MHLKGKIMPRTIFFEGSVILSGRRWVVWWGGIGGDITQDLHHERIYCISQPFLWWSCSCLFYEGCTEVDWQIRAYHELIICWLTTQCYHLVARQHKECLTVHPPTNRVCLYIEISVSASIE